MHPHDESVHPHSTTLADDPADRDPENLDPPDDPVADAIAGESTEPRPDDWRPDAEPASESAERHPDGGYPAAEPILPVDETAAARSEPAPWGVEDERSQAATDVAASEPIAGGSGPLESTVDDAPVGGWTSDTERAAAEAGVAEPAGDADDPPRAEDDAALAEEGELAEPVAGEPGVVVVEPAGDAVTEDGVAGAEAWAPATIDGEPALIAEPGDEPADDAGVPADVLAAGEPAQAPDDSELAGGEVVGIEHAEGESMNGTAVDTPVGVPVDTAPADAAPVDAALVAVAADDVPAEAKPGGLGDEQPLVATADIAALRDRWRDVLAGFVDDPAASVAQASDLVDEAVRVLTSGLAEIRDSVREWSGDEPPTERMRVAVRRYRSVFDRLMED